MPLAAIGFGEALLLIIEIFLFAAWIWILIAIVSDLFRDHALSGWVKAAWILVLVLVPFLGVLIYLVARGDGMRGRTIAAQLDAKRQFDDYIREQFQSTPVSDLEKLNELRRAGVVSEEEFARAKAKLDAKRQLDDYIREQSQSTPVSDLEKLNELRRAGVVSEEAFTRAKAKLLG